MWLHAGAGLHGHEYSPSPSNSTSRRTPLVRSAFSAPASRISTGHDSSKTTYIRPARRISSESSKVHERVSFREPDVDTMSEDGGSYANSIGSEATTEGTKRKRRSIRTSTSYHLAHPAPTLTQKQKLLKIRPKVLLQFQRVSPTSRPMPILDVLPSSVVAPRLAQRFPRMFKGKAELGINDVMVVKSEDYNDLDREDNEDKIDDDTMDNREVLAVVCQLRGMRGSTEICFSDGSKWFAVPLPKGFEFVSTDPDNGEKTTARWVPKARSKRDSATSPTIPACDQKYHFSILDPNSRRHPILASVTQTSLDIPDCYTSVSSSSGRCPPTSPIRTPLPDSQHQIDETEPRERTTHLVDESLRTLIQVTAVWVALRNGWCQNFRYDDNAPGVSGVFGPISSTAGNRRRSTSLTPETGRPVVVDTQASTPESHHSSFGGKMLRTGTHMFRSSPNTSNLQFDTAAPIPQRAISTGTAFMQRAAAARKSGHSASTAASDNDLESLSSSPQLASTAGANAGNGILTPSPLALFGSSTSPLETPTRHQRVQSGNKVPLQRAQSSGGNAAQRGNGHSESSYELDSHVSGRRVPQRDGRPKAGRWKSFINCFRHLRGDRTH